MSNSQWDVSHVTIDQNYRENLFSINSKLSSFQITHSFYPAP